MLKGKPNTVKVSKAQQTDLTRESIMDINKGLHESPFSCRKKPVRKRGRISLDIARSILSVASEALGECHPRVVSLSHSFLHVISSLGLLPGRNFVLPLRPVRITESESEAWVVERVNLLSHSMLSIFFALLFQFNSQLASAAIDLRAECEDASTAGVNDVGSSDDSQALQVRKGRGCQVPSHDPADMQTMYCLGLTRTTTRQNSVALPAVPSVDSGHSKSRDVAKDTHITASSRCDFSAKERDWNPLSSGCFRANLQELDEAFEFHEFEDSVPPLMSFETNPLRAEPSCGVFPACKTTCEGPDATLECLKELEQATSIKIGAWLDAWGELYIGCDPILDRLCDQVCRELEGAIQSYYEIDVRESSTRKQMKGTQCSRDAEANVRKARPAASAASKRISTVTGFSSPQTEQALMAPARESVPVINTPPRNLQEIPARTKDHSSDTVLPSNCSAVQPPHAQAESSVHAAPHGTNSCVVLRRKRSNSDDTTQAQNRMKVRTLKLLKNDSAHDGDYHKLSMSGTVDKNTFTMLGSSGVEPELALNASGRCAGHNADLFRQIQSSLYKQSSRPISDQRRQPSGAALTRGARISNGNTAGPPKLSLPNSSPQWTHVSVSRQFEENLESALNAFLQQDETSTALRANTESTLKELHEGVASGVAATSERTENKGAVANVATDSNEPARTLEQIAQETDLPYDSSNYNCQNHLDRMLEDFEAFAEFK